MDLFLIEFIQIINDNLIDGYKKKSIFLMFTIEETRIAMKDEIVKKNIIENIDKISGFEFEFKSIEDYEIFVFEEYYNRTNVVFKSYFHKEDILDWDIKKFDKALVKVEKIVKDINKKAIICTKNTGIFDISLYKIIFFTEYLYRNILYNYMFFDVSKIPYSYIPNNLKKEKNNIQSIEGILNGRSICEGYSNIATIVLNELGVKCSKVIAKLEDGSHAWNIIKYNNNWYNIDFTMVIEKNEYFENEGINFNLEYFMISDDKINKKYGILNEDKKYLEENMYCNYDLDKKDIINILKSLKLKYTKKDKKRLRRIKEKINRYVSYDIEERFKKDYYHIGLDEYLNIREEKGNFNEKKMVLHLKDEDLKKIIYKNNIVDYIYNNRSKIAYIIVSIKDITNYTKGIFNKIMKGKKYLSDYIYLDIKNRSENIISKLEENIN